MAIVPQQADLIAEASTLSLARYARLIGYPEDQFWGVRNDATMVDYECRTIWIKRERDMVSKYLAEAQEEIEAICRYPIGYKWIASERQPYGFPLLSKWGWVLEGGVEGRTAIGTDAAVSHLADHAVIGPIATTVTDEDEVRVYYPATLVEEQIEIMPSDIDIAGGFVTIYVPRCRMVHPDYADNDRQGVDYTDTLNAFLQTVDVVRVYNDDSTQATLVWPHDCASGTGCGCTCSDYQRDACIYVKDSEIGALDVLAATYSGGSWSVTTGCRCGGAQYALLNYRAGKAMTHQMEDAIMRLAHAKMPETPCGCDIMKAVWLRDRNEPRVFTKERLNCPFGLSDGAWAAWRFTQTFRLMRGGGL
jgi:hypothetical protein